MLLPDAVSAAGWMIYSVDTRRGSPLMTLRNVRLSASTAPQAIASLTLAMLNIGWAVIHQGQEGPIWSVLLQKEPA